MFELLFLFIMITDGMVIGVIAALLCRWFFGDAPFARLIRLILSICGGVGYFLLCIDLGLGEHDISMGICGFVILLPIGILAILKVVDYMFKNEKDE